MLTAPAAVDITFDDDSWGVPPVKLAYNRSVSVGNSWGVTSIGRGFNWAAEEEEESEEESNGLSNAQGDSKLADSSLNTESFVTQRSPGYTFATPASSGTLYPPTILTPSTPLHVQTKTSRITSDPLTLSPTQSPSLTSRPLTPSTSSLHISHINAPPRPVRSPTSPRPRRRSSQQRVSLIAGRLSIAPIEPPSPPPVAPQKLIRSGSTASLLSLDTSTRPPTPSASIITQDSSDRSISEFVIQGEIGRGAYGLVKKAREMNADGRLGVSDVVIVIYKPYLNMTLDSRRS
jgi:protein-serine/threonine kinase